MRRFLKLRHQLIPYTYTMNYLTYSQSLPLITPVYYRHPAPQDAYKVKNEYFFGTELMINPITSKNNAELRMGSVLTWLPEGRWTDVFTGLKYNGNRRITMWRSIDTIPALAKEGSIIPLAPEESVSSSTDNPKELELIIITGADGSFTMYEDDGISPDYERGKCVKTLYSLDNSKGTFTIHAAIGELSLIPERRSYILKFYGLNDRAIDGAEYDSERNIATIKI